MRNGKDIREKRWLLTGLIAWVTICLLPACSATEKLSPEANRKTIMRTPASGWVWDPQYYVYDGRYKFIGGRYRKVISRKAYLKRSLGV